MTSHVFPWNSKAVKGRLYCFTWSDKRYNDNTRFEFYLPKLYSHAIEDLLAHCVEVRSTIEEKLLPDEYLCASACFNVFPRTLSLTLNKEWKQLETVTMFRDYSIQHFDELLMKFIASYTSDQDRIDLVNQIRYPVKPSKQSVLSFYTRLLELNDVVNLLPGDDEPLTELQLKQALFDGMPITWRETFMSSELSFSTMTRKEMVRYFHTQEVLAAKKRSEWWESCQLCGGLLFYGFVLFHLIQLFFF
jgi:hypothetical protein